MGRGRGRAQCALWGGISLGVGTLAFALFSPSSAGCSTNVVVLTRSAVTARGCAAYSVLSRLGIGMIVLGAVLLLGSFALALGLRTRKKTTIEAATGVGDLVVTVPAAASAAVVVPSPTGSTTTVSVPASTDLPPTSAVPPKRQESETRQPPTFRAERQAPESQRDSQARLAPIAPGDDLGGAPDPASGAAINLPPGWYGNPDNPGKAVQWWDGTKLTDRPD